MNTLTFTDDQLYQLIDALDEARNILEDNYDWMKSQGYNVADHPWQRFADASTMLDKVVEASDAANVLETA